MCKNCLKKWNKLNDIETSIKNLREVVLDFVRERDWEKYHNPKDIAEGICIEAAELLQLFQWIKPEESSHFRSNSAKVRKIKEELADVFVYCLTMANSLDIDVTSAVVRKIRQNEKKYPVSLYWGKAHLTDDSRNDESARRRVK